MVNILKRFIGWFGYRGFIGLLHIFSFVPDVKGDEETVSEIIRDHKSVSRFGDGEFLWILMERENGQFERNSERLSKQLNRVLHSRQANLMVCIPNVYKGFKDYKPKAQLFWERLLLRRGFRIQKLLEPRTYYTSQFTRPYIDFDPSKKYFQSKFNLVKGIWNERNVVIVEGDLTRFGVGSDLLDGARSVKRIICPGKNAFETYDTIFENVRSYVEEDTDVLVLAALGPTATVLAADLASVDVQCVDIGHLDLEYEWYLHHVQSRTPIAGRDVNEIVDESVESLPADIELAYQKEIAVRVKKVS